MPIYEYQAVDTAKACSNCMNTFEHLQKISDPPIGKCPVCDGAVVRVISAPAVGASKSNLDDRAKSQGFKKYKKIGKGEYEKQY